MYLIALLRRFASRLVRMPGLAATEQGEKGSTDFACDIANSTLSHHIKQLREAGVVVHRKEGTRCFVALRPELEATFPGLLGSILKHGRPER